MQVFNSVSYFRVILMGIFLCAGLSFNSTAQIKIGTNGATIAPSSILELESNNQGLLLTRLADTAAINALNPPNGMLIYLTRQPAVGLYVRKVSGWEYITGSMGGNGNFNSLTVAQNITAGSFSGPLNGNATSANIALSANVSLASAVTNDLATANPVYPVFAIQTPGNVGLRTSTTQLSFIPNTGILTARGFAGDLVGNVAGNATSATDAVNASNTDITDDVVSPTVHYPTFVSGTDGDLPQKTSSTNLSFIPQTGELTAPRFRGALIGNASSATNVTGVVAAVNGGTGHANYSPGDLLYAATSATIERLPIGTNNTVLRVAGGLPTWSTAGAGTVTNVTGVANRISVVDNTIEPIIDIAAGYVGQPSITTVGTITAGNWNAGVIPVTSGGTGLGTLPTGLLVGNGTLPVTTVTGNVGYVLTSTGTTTPPEFRASGGGDMILAAPQQVTGLKTFDFNRFSVTGSAGRTTILNASPGVGSSSVELPPDGIIVNRDRPETLLNKTLDNPILVSPDLGVASGTSLTTTGDMTAPRFISNVGTGTSPFTVNSTTPVPNLSIGGNAATATTALNFTGNLLGDVTGTQGATVVSTVGNIAATGANSIVTGVNAANNATSNSIANRIVLRDGSMNFSAGTITATLDGTASNVRDVVVIANGGTGQNNKTAGFNALSPITTAGDLIIGNGANSSVRLPAGGSNTFLKGGTSPSWSTINLAAATPEITGVLLPANGGTGISNANTLTLTGGNITLTTGGATNVTLPASGTLVAALSASINHDFTVTTAFNDVILPVAGAALGDPVVLGIPTESVVDNGVYSAWVSAPDFVTIRITKTGGAGNPDPDAGTFNVKVLK